MHSPGGYPNIENEFFMISIAIFQAGNNSAAIFLCRKLLDHEYSNLLKLTIKHFVILPRTFPR